MKLMQVVRGLAEITTRRPPARTATPLALALRATQRAAAAKRRQTISVLMQDLPDIPQPVKITHFQQSAPQSPLHCQAPQR